MRVINLLRILGISFIFTFFLFVFFAAFTPQANAKVTFSPDREAIDETVFKVTVKFDNLIQGKEYGFCGNSNSKDCFKTAVFEFLPPVKAQPDGTLTFTVCGKGHDEVKRESDCEEGKDYFRGGNTYGINLVALDTKSVYSALFFVKYYFPDQDKITIAPEDPTPGQQITVTMSQSKLRAGSVKKDNRNEYEVTLESTTKEDFEIKSNCVKITQPNTPITIDVPKDDELNNLEADTYILYIKGCADNDDVIFYQAIVPVDNESETKVGELTKNEALSTEDEADLPPPPPPCATLGPLGECLAVDTAVGQINTSPEGFIKSIFSLILGLSGGLALLLIIYSGFQLVTSRGIPEKLEGAREQLVSAIIGLVFIILSLAILQIIGVDILKIPGFTR